MVLESSKKLPSLSDIRSFTLNFPSLSMSLAGQSFRSCLKTRPRRHYCRYGNGGNNCLLNSAPFCPAGHIQMVITPLNLLGRQNVEFLEKAGMKAIFIVGADTATSENFLVSQPQILKYN